MSEDTQDPRVKVYDPNSTRADFNVLPYTDPAGTNTFRQWLADHAGGSPVAPMIFTYQRTEKDANGQEISKTYTAYGIQGDISLAQKAKLLSDYSGSNAAGKVANAMPGLSASGGLVDLDNGELLNHGSIDITLPGAVEKSLAEWQRRVAGSIGQPVITFTGQAHLTDLPPVGPAVITRVCRFDIRAAPPAQARRA